MAFSISLSLVTFSLLKYCLVFFHGKFFQKKSAFPPTVYLIVTLFFTLASVLHMT